MGVASTGVIGVGLDREPVVAGIGRAVGELSPDGGAVFAEAIMTTDRWAKHGALEVALSGGSVRLCAQAKGAGMISPSFATMLCFIQTDAAIDAVTLDRLLRAAVARSFERTSVDGQLSTNDSVFCLASGAAGVAVDARNRGRAAPSARRSTRCCASSRSRSSPTARAPSASRGSWCAARSRRSTRSRAPWQTHRS